MAGKLINLRFVVWQFVRIMVQLENSSRARGQKNASTLYSYWRPAWQEIDNRLTETGKSDANAFSDLMMEQEVVLELYNSQSSRDTRLAIDKVLKLINSEIQAHENKSQERNNLRFELRELIKTRDSLK